MDSPNIHKHSKPPGILIIMLIIFALIGIAWAIYGINRNLKIMKVSKWPKTSAKILRSESIPTSAYASFNFLNPNELMINSVTSGFNQINIEYEYLIEDWIYRNNGLAYGGPKTYNTETTKQILSNNTVGETVQIFYNNSNPSESYIYVDNYNYFGIAIGTVLAITTIIMLLLLMHK